MRRTSKYGNMNKSNVYDSFSMSNKFQEMSSTPDNTKTRYVTSKNMNNSYMGMRKSYASGKGTNNQNILSVQRLRQSESTKPQRDGHIVGKTPNKARNSKMRASSNPRMGSRELHNMSSSSIKGRKGQLMSSSKIGKIINEQTTALMKQRERIKRIYEPDQSAIMASSSNIKVTDEFPSITSK